MRIRLTRNTSATTRGLRKAPRVGALHLWSTDRHTALAVRGKVIASPNSVTIPIRKIKNPINYSIADDNGIFRFNVLPGEYTFFMLFKDKAYLNDFDGQGNFSSIKIHSRIDDLVLFDYGDALY